MREGTELILHLVLAAALVAAPDIHDSLEPVVLAEPQGLWLPAWAIAVAALIVVAALTTGMLLYRKRARAGASPEDRTRRRLAKAAIANLDSKSLYTELNNILIEYVDARSGIPATRRTSLELQQLFERRDDVDAKFQTTLAGFLADCDHAKFSPSPPVDCNRESAIADCRTIIAGIRAMRDKG
jgi:hypothetical protein